MDNTKLIAALEGATGPSRELDAEIGRYAAAAFLGYIPESPQHGCATYTASIDAALTLVPEGCTVSLNIDRDRQTEATLESGWDAFVGYSPTPALAICIAALRAREARP